MRAAFPGSAFGFFNTILAAVRVLVMDFFTIQIMISVIIVGSLHKTEGAICEIAIDKTLSCVYN